MKAHCSTPDCPHAVDVEPRKCTFCLLEDTIEEGRRKLRPRRNPRDYFPLGTGEAHTKALLAHRALQHRLKNSRESFALLDSLVVDYPKRAADETDEQYEVRCDFTSDVRKAICESLLSSRGYGKVGTPNFSILELKPVSPETARARCDQQIHEARLRARRRGFDVPGDTHLAGEGGE